MRQIGWILLAIAALIGLFAFSFNRDKPVLGLVSSLPLALPEGDVVAVLGHKAEPHPAYRALQSSYTIRPLDTVGQLRDVTDLDLLLVAQPRAFSPQDYVALDNWVRAGGKLLLMLDPQLEWPSAYPFGDPRRPQPVALMSPILSHWGLEFRYDDNNVVQVYEWNGEPLALTSAGEFAATDQQGHCKSGMRAVLMHCKIGSGQVLLFGDADILRSAVQPDSTDWRFVESLLDRTQSLK